MFEDPEVVVVVRGAVRREVRPCDGEEERGVGFARMVWVVGIWQGGGIEDGKGRGAGEGGTR